MMVMNTSVCVRLLLSYFPICDMIIEKKGAAFRRNLYPEQFIYGG